MEARLLVLNGPESGLLVRLKQDTLIGRSENCSVRSMNPTVSRMHCRIFEHKEKYFIEDMGSRNGTFVNETRINSPQEIMDGDKIHVATVQFKFIRFNDSSSTTEELILEDDQNFQRITLKSD